MNRTARLDPDLNRLPEELQHIHIIGICGTGMAAMAGMLKQRGFHITGSDQNVYPPMSEFLTKAGIPILQGYEAGNLSPRPDLVIVGNVVTRFNAEAIALADQAIPYLSMPQALGHFFLEGHRPLVVAGTHGKTTTASLLATSLYRLGESPGFMIGGIVEAFGRNFNVSDSVFFVVEGDEYDTAFFNKVSKFHHYRPHCAILTSIEFDHADIFKDLDAIKASFGEFIQRLPEHGCLVANIDDPAVAELSLQARCKVISYGTRETCDYQVQNLQARGLASHMTVCRRQKDVYSFQLPMVGQHNAMNATAVIALLDELGYDPERGGEVLASFEGVKRRQQVRGEVGGITVIDDFAHHPTAVRATVQALQHGWPDRRLLVVFEPRTNTSRRAVFQKDYARAFDHADVVVVREHVPLDTVPRSEQFSSSQLVHDLQQRGVQSNHFPDTERIIEHLAHYCRQGDIVAILSNGGFDNIHERLLDRFAELY